MRIFKRVPSTVFVAAIGALSMALVVGTLNAFGDGHGRHDEQLIKESLAPSLPGDPAFHGVDPGGAPWVLTDGRVRLKSDGELDLRVRGLVIPIAPFNGTPGPVTTINASLYCGADSEKAAVATTEQVPISSSGNARIDDSLTVPSTCLSPVILVHPNGIATLYIALDGWRM